MATALPELPVTRQAKCRGTVMSDDLSSCRAHSPDSGVEQAGIQETGGRLKDWGPLHRMQTSSRVVRVHDALQLPLREAQRPHMNRSILKGHQVG